MNNFKLYVHIAPNNKMYIGITSKSTKKRWGTQGQGYESQKLFWRAIQKYGWNNIKHIVLLENLSEEMAYECEKYLIAKFNTTNPKYGYNISSGGEFTHSGCKFSDEVRQHLSEVHKKIGVTEAQLVGLRKRHLEIKGKHLSEEHKQKISKANTGKIRSLETRKKISEVQIGRVSPRKGTHLSEETKEKLRQANLGKKASPETIAKMKSNGSQYWKGKTRSLETRLKISKSLKERSLKCRIEGNNLNPQLKKLF